MPSESIPYKDLFAHCEKCPLFKDPSVCMPPTQQRKNTSQLSSPERLPEAEEWGRHQVEIVENTPESSPPKRQRTDTFLNRLPEPEGWGRRQVETVEDATKYQAAIRSFVQDGILVQGRPQTQLSGSLTEIGTQLATIAKASLQNEKLQRSIACFQVFLLLSYLGFLKYIKQPQEIISRIISLIPEFNCFDHGRLLNVIERLHDLIGKLVKIKWTLSRATETFFLCR